MRRGRCRPELESIPAARWRRWYGRAGGSGMTTLAQYVECYFTIRQTLGFKLRSERRMLVVVVRL
jgi:hypothetical protein